MNIIDQLIDIYENHEHWHVNRLSREDAVEYFIRLLTSGNIIVYLEDGALAGYVEFWRITPSQFRKVLDNDFYVFDENITDGEICFISSIFIHKEYRMNNAIKSLKNIFLGVNKGCKFFVGKEQKHNKRIKIMENKYGIRKDKY